MSTNRPEWLDDMHIVERPCIVTDDGVEYPAVAYALIPKTADFDTLTSYSVRFSVDNMPPFLSAPAGKTKLVIMGVPRTQIRFTE